MKSYKVEQAIDRLKAFVVPEQPYWVGYSGGKDSDVLRVLCELADVPYELHHNHTTVDAPETYYHISSVPNVIRHYPDKTMWELIVHIGMPPTRMQRYCCSELKERGGKGRIKVLGVRWAESVRRKNGSDLVMISGKPATVRKRAERIGVERYTNSKQGGILMSTDNDDSRRMIEQCFRDTSTRINPIIDWTDSDVWEFLRHYNVRVNPLYDEGWSRIGCVACPLVNVAQRLKDFARWPTYKEAYMRAFDLMLKKREARGKPYYKRKTAEQVWDWWMWDSQSAKTQAKGQTELILEEEL